MFEIHVRIDDVYDGATDVVVANRSRDKGAERCAEKISGALDIHIEESQTKDWNRTDDTNRTHVQTETDSRIFRLGHEKFDSCSVFSD